MVQYAPPPPSNRPVVARLQVMKAVEDLYHLSWITRQQQLNLEALILSRADTSPATCCRRDTQLQAAQFIDSYKQLGPIVSRHGALPALWVERVEVL